MKSIHLCFSYFLAFHFSWKNILGSEEKVKIVWDTENKRLLLMLLSGMFLQRQNKLWFGDCPVVASATLSSAGPWPGTQWHGSDKCTKHCGAGESKTYSFGYWCCKYFSCLSFYLSTDGLLWMWTSKCCSYMSICPLPRIK